jgi:uncharacterized protein (TIGR02266 family)
LDNRQHPRFPIRLAVRYPSARSLLGDYTKSISKGGVAIDSERNLEVGTEFIFEMSAPELPQPLEVKGRVVWIRAIAQTGKYTMGIQYQFPDDERRERLETVIETILAEHQWERQRKHPRMPVSIEVVQGKRLWLIRDLSLGGAHVQSLTKESVDFGVGQRVRFEIRVSEFDAAIDSEVVWTGQPYEVHGETIMGRFGVKFVGVGPEVEAIIDQVMRAQVVPSRVAMSVKPAPKRGLD